MTREHAQTVMRTLLPGLHYLAAEALRAGCVDASQIILDAIRTIEHRLTIQGGNHEQGDLCAPGAGGDVAH